MTKEEMNRLRAHLLEELAVRRRNTVTVEGYKRAGVLVPLIAEPGGFSLLFTKRTDTVETHKGQVSFPGGMVDEEDTDIVHTALREIHEEVGVPREAIRVIGLLDDLPTPTGFVITPVVGILESLPTLQVNIDEVAEVFQAPLSFFTDPENVRMELRRANGRIHEVWFFDNGRHNIWGATAMIIRSLLKVLRLIS